MRGGAGGSHLGQALWRRLWRREETSSLAAHLMHAAPVAPCTRCPAHACRRFWQHKGDVFHLLLGMAIALDDR